MGNGVTDSRLSALTAWLEQTANDVCHLRPASGDASFRRYFRLDTDAGSRIAMDAPPDREPIEPFLEIAKRLAHAGVHVPGIHAADPMQGFVLLDDFGQEHFLDVLHHRNAETLYKAAFEALIRLQSADCRGLPTYDKARLQQELDLFHNWLLEHHLGLKLDRVQRTQLFEVYEQLIDNALAQPSVFVHRDYHARNLMLTRDATTGVLDFQDAVCGPLTYDVVSLLRDAYISWQDDLVQRWALSYRDSAVAAGVCQAVDDAQFLRWFDLMGLQRHLKVLGIFSRLHHRDGKSNYLNDMPRVLNYVEMIAPRYPESAPLAELIESLDLRRRMEEMKILCVP